MVFDRCFRFVIKHKIDLRAIRRYGNTENDNRSGIPATLGDAVLQAWLQDLTLTRTQSHTFEMHR